jgi:hypothetical protein
VGLGTPPVYVRICLHSGKGMVGNGQMVQYSKMETDLGRPIHVMTLRILYCISIYFRKPIFYEFVENHQNNMKAWVS